MRRTPQLTEMFFIGGVVAMAGWLFVTYGLFHALVMIALVAGVIGSYVLRRQARLALVYNRIRRRPQPTATPTRCPMPKVTAMATAPPTTNRATARRRPEEPR